MTPMRRLTDTALKAELRKERVAQEELPDGSVPGLSVRVGGGTAATWSLVVRVSGEGGTSRRGLKLKGRRRRLTLGRIRPWNRGCPGAGQRLSRSSQEGRKSGDFAGARGHRRWPDRPSAISSIPRRLCAREGAPLGPKIPAGHPDAHQSDHWSGPGRCTGSGAGARSDSQGARATVAYEQRKRTGAWGQRGGADRRRSAATHRIVGDPREAHERVDDPASDMEKNLPKKRKKDRYCHLRGSHCVAGGRFGGICIWYPRQLMLLTGCRAGEWARAVWPWVDLKQNLLIIPGEGLQDRSRPCSPARPRGRDDSQENSQGRQR